MLKYSRKSSDAAHVRKTESITIILTVQIFLYYISFFLVS